MGPGAGTPAQSPNGGGRGGGSHHCAQGGGGVAGAVKLDALQLGAGKIVIETDPQLRSLGSDPSIHHRGSRWLDRRLCPEPHGVPSA